MGLDLRVLTSIVFYIFGVFYSCFVDVLQMCGYLRILMSLYFILFYFVLGKLVHRQCIIRILYYLISSNFSGLFQEVQGMKSMGTIVNNTTDFWFNMEV